VKLGEPLPRAGIITLFVIMPLTIAILMLASAAVIGWLLGETLPVGVLLVSISAHMLATGLRAVLSCVDWFEARSARRAHG
jgi:hypothetical protein